MSANELLRAWLATACGVPVSQVTDEHLRDWDALCTKVQAHVATEESGRAARANARALGVHFGGDR